MQGFTDSANPVILYLLQGSTLGTGPFVINGEQASLTGGGITADVNGTRYWVPVHLIDHIEQVQTAVEPGQEPQEAPAPPTPPNP
jgi:hypothetical protein